MAMGSRRVIVVGLFSAKDDSYDAVMDELEAAQRGAGNVVVGRAVQRKGVSRGGVKRMRTPVDAATYIGRGKAEEVAALCARTNADLVVFRGAPSISQIVRLQRLFACEVIAVWQTIDSRSTDD
jgi:50S ribosomal subunit-associated GTPase HflX